MSIDLDKFFDDYRPIVHLTKEDFNIWYNNLQKDLAKLIFSECQKIAQDFQERINKEYTANTALSKPSVVSVEEIEKVILEFYYNQQLGSPIGCKALAREIYNLRKEDI